MIFCLFHIDSKKFSNQSFNIHCITFSGNLEQFDVLELRES